MKKLIVGNWKMNPASSGEALRIAKGIKKVKTIKNRDVIVCPPFPYISLVKSQGVKVGAQDVSEKEGIGAHTGEVSGLLLKKNGATHVIIGHSERRALGEDGSVIMKKIEAALKEGLKVIVCVGESRDVWARGRSHATKFVSEQLEESLHTVLHHASFADHCIIAYEPLWAIGTGNACSVTDAQNMITIIKEFIASHTPPASIKKGGVRVLYGGSVNGKNAGEFLLNPVIDGVLVGGASLNVKDFLKIVKSGI